MLVWLYLKRVLASTVRAVVIDENRVVFTHLHMVHWQLIVFGLPELPTVSELVGPVLIKLDIYLVFNRKGRSFSVVVWDLPLELHFEPVVAGLGLPCATCLYFIMPSM